jgi:hypothetical protein
MSRLKDLKSKVEFTNKDLERFFEEAFVKSLLNKLFKAGYSVQIQQEETELSIGTRYSGYPQEEFTFDHIIDTIFNYDEVELICRKGFDISSFVEFSFGNGVDCLSDYSNNLDKIIQSAKKDLYAALINFKS